MKTPNSGANPATLGIRPAASVPPPHRLDCESGLSVVFTWDGDRYRHSIRLYPATEFHSVEGTPEEDWPASPAIQQLSTETIEDRLTVLGVGCCGTTHFSVSVQQRVNGSGRSVLRFDWAARLSRPLPASQIDEKSIDEKSIGLASGYRTECAGLGDPLVGNDLLAGLTALAGTKFERVGVGPQDFRFKPATIEGIKTVQWSYEIG